MGRRLPSLRNVEDRNILALENRRLVGYIVKSMGHLFREEERDDALQVGFIALMRAAELFDEKKHVKFSTYACRTIYNSLGRWKLTSGIIKIPAWTVDTARRTEKSLADAKKAMAMRREKEISELPLHERHTAASIDAADEAALVAEKLCHLAPLDREAVVRCIMHDETMRSVAERFGKTASWANLACKRGIKQLKRMVGMPA
jgi:RNA polymerase sigma factor (sigma-70 family)